MMISWKQAAAHSHTAVEHASLVTSVLSKDALLVENASHALETQIGSALRIFEDPHSSLVRRAGPADAFRLCRLVVLAALMASVAVAWSTGQKYRYTRDARQDSRLASTHPWPLLPSSEQLAAAGLTFVDDPGTTMRRALLARGLLPCRGVALISTCPVGKAGRALMQRSLEIGKRPFAIQLRRIGLQDMAPATFRRPFDLSNALQIDHNSSRRAPALQLSAGIWLLKHSAAGLDVDGITCFKGAASLLKFWQSMPKSTRSSFIAQADISRPMTLAGGNVKVQGFVLALESGPSFLHRELLLTSMSAVESSCTLHSAMLGRSWVHYDSVWSQVRQALMKVLRHSSWRWTRALDSKTVARPTPCEEGCLSFNLFVVDAAVDQDRRPWLLDMYPLPDRATLNEDPANCVWDTVMKDSMGLLLKPFSGQLQGASNKASAATHPAHGFVDLSGRAK